MVTFTIISQVLASYTVWKFDDTLQPGRHFFQGADLDTGNHKSSRLNSVDSRHSTHRLATRTSVFTALKTLTLSVGNNDPAVSIGLMANMSLVR